jgi:hypothetical protein
MDYFHWIGGTLFLLYGISLVGVRMFVLFTITWVPATLLIMHLLSGWTATVAALVALAVVGRECGSRCVSGSEREREQRMFLTIA